MVAAPATADGPNCATACVTKAAPTGVARLVSTAGPATVPSARASPASREASKRPSMRCVTSTPCSPMAASTRRETTALMAAPSSPRPKPKIKIGSSTAVTKAAASVTVIERRASPTERSSAEAAMPIPSSGSVCTVTER
jgi:hypothetical protein